MLVKNLAAKEPSALGLDTYYKQYYLCLAAASATIKWYNKFFSPVGIRHEISGYFLFSHPT